MSTPIRDLYRENMDSLWTTFNQLDFSDREIYGLYMEQVFYLATHATRLLCRAASHLGVEDQKLHRKFVVHALEEVDHEALARADLRYLKREPVNIMAEAKEIIRLQLEWIDKVPLSFYGYVVILEGLALEAATDVYETALKNFGPRAVTFLKLHIAEDPDHVDKAFEMFDDLDEEALESVRINMNQSTDLYKKMMLSIKEHREVTVPSAAQSTLDTSL